LFPEFSSYFFISKQDKNLFLSSKNLLKQGINFARWQDVDYILAGCSMQGGRIHSVRWQDVVCKVAGCKN
jgi:hypothetical protein